MNNTCDYCRRGIKGHLEVNTLLKHPMLGILLVLEESVRGVDGFGSYFTVLPVTATAEQLAPHRLLSRPDKTLQFGQHCTIAGACEVLVDANSLECV